MPEKNRWSKLFGRKAAQAAGNPDAGHSSVGLLEDENRKLRRAVEELTTLNDLARTIGASLNSEQVISRIASRSMRAVKAEQAVITLIDQEENDDQKTLVRVKRTGTEGESFHLDPLLKGQILLYKKPILSNEPQTDEQIRGVQLADTIHSLLCVPLMVQSSIIGVLTAYNKKGGRKFDDHDQRLLAIIGSQSAQVIENARLNEKQKEMAFLQEQIRLAGDIQLKLLPKKVPDLGEYEVAGTSIPAQDVGGDYFDFINVDDDHIALCLGDVSGKGLPASLLMANLQATLRGQTLLAAPASTCVSRSNRLLYHSTDPEKFATLFYGVLDRKNHQLQFCNAGHERPLHFSGTNPDEPPTRLASGGLILGFLPEFEYTHDTIDIASGDVLVIFSDGVSDAENPEEDPFTDGRLEKLVRECCHESAAEILERIIAAVNEHAGSAAQLDDITTVVLKRR